MGPALNYLYGIPIYFGIVESNIADACLIILVGIVSFTLPHIIFKNRKLSLVFYNERHGWISLYPIFLISIMYGLIKLLIMLPYRISGFSKIELINLALPSIHYIYLLIQLYLCSFYLNIIYNKKLKRLYYLNLIIYVFYCMILGERDFIFPIFSIFILKTILGKRRDVIKYSFLSILLLCLATAIFFFRDSTQNTQGALGSILNQGSILFINSYVLKILDNGESFFYGYTYVNSIMNLLPSWLYKSSFNLQQWFHDLYAKNSTSGYGFSLDAEAYLNFGYYGVGVFFFLLSMYWKILLSKFNYSDFFRYMTFFSIGFTMYSLRNDSLALFKGSLYAALVYLFANTTSYLMVIGRKE